MGGIVTIQYHSEFRDWNDEEDLARCKNATLYHFKELTEVFNKISIEAFCAYYYKLDFALNKKEMGYINQLHFKPFFAGLAPLFFEVGSDQSRKKSGLLELCFRNPPQKLGPHPKYDDPIQATMELKSY